MRNVNEEGLNFIKQWEGLRLEAYLDTGGVLTIGYGHTSAAGSPQVTKGMKISKEVAEKILAKDLDKFEADVSRLVKVPLTDNQFATLVSFHYNTGALAKSTLLKKLNRGEYDSVPSELGKWVYDNGKRIKGLVNRRAAEAGLWVRGEFVSSNYSPVQKNISEETETTTVGIGGTASAIAVSVQPVIDVFTEHEAALTSGNIAKVAVSAIIIGLTIFFVWKKSR